MNALLKILEQVKQLDETDITFLRHELDRMDGSVSIRLDYYDVEQALENMIENDQIVANMDEINDVIKTGILMTTKDYIDDGVNFQSYIESAIKHHIG